MKILSTSSYIYLWQEIFAVGIQCYKYKQKHRKTPQGTASITEKWHRDTYHRH